MKRIAIGILAVLSLLPQGGRAGEVVIQRDRWGVPHIYGGSAREVAFGSGYAQAEDHLDRMLRLYLKARGELSRVEGQSALGQDFIQRMLLIGEIVDAGWQRVPAAGKEFYRGFADGINRYQETHPALKQPWYWKVSARDVAIYGRFTILRNGWGVAGKKLTGNAGGDGIEGSNAWAVGAGRSANGHAMLLADPHLPWQSDVQWYESHLRCPEFDMAGAGFFGMPLPLVGHNGEIAWTATNNGADIADIYSEKIDPQNPNRYLDDDGQWKAMDERTFRFEVRQADGSWKTVERGMRYTRRGPYVPGPKGSYSVAIAGWRDLADPLTGSLRRAGARNLESFKTSLAEFPMDKWHLVYADRAGNIYVVGNGLFPRRDAKYDWRRPLPGWEKEAQWKGIHAFRELPQFANPASGLIVQCNNSIYSSARPAAVEPEKYPPYMASPQVDVGPDTRAARAYDLLAGRGKISWEDHRAAALDVRALTAGPLLRLLVGVLDGRPEAAGDLGEMRRILKGWDRMATLENRAVPILSHWTRLAAAKDLDATAGREQAWQVLEETAAEMRKLYGTVAVEMRDVQVVERGTRQFPIPGVGSDRALNPFTSLFMSAGGRYEKGKWYGTGGSSWLMLVAFDTPIRVESLMPTGESEDPASPHFADLTELYSKRSPKPFPFTDAQVKEYAGKSYRLKL